MGLTIIKKKDSRVVRAFTHKLADIVNGITVAVADLVAGVPLLEGTPIGVDSNGLGHVVKTAELASNATATDTTYVVKKGHHFKVGDFIMLGKGAKAYAITAIATNSDNSAYDDITVGTTLGTAANAGDVIAQSAAQSTSTTSAYKYNAIALVGESYDVNSNENLIVNAVTIGQIKSACAPKVTDDIKDALNGIIFV